MPCRFAFLIVCAGLGLSCSKNKLSTSAETPPANEPERAAIELIVANGGSVVHDRMIAGNSVIEVDLVKSPITDAGLKQTYEVAASLSGRSANHR